MNRGEIMIKTRVIMFFMGLVFCLVGCTGGYTFDKTSGVPGDLITVTGVGMFTPCQGRHQILFGDVSTACAEEWTRDKIIFPVPQGYPEGTKLPVVLWFYGYFPIQIGEFTITGEDPDHDEFAFWIWSVTALAALNVEHGVMSETDPTYVGAVTLIQFLFDFEHGYSQMDPVLKAQISHEIVMGGDLPALWKAFQPFIGEMTSCDPDPDLCEPSAAIVAQAQNLRPVAEAQFSIAEDSPNPWGDVAAAWGKVSITATAIGLMAADAPIAIAAGLIAIGAESASIYLQYVVDNYAPTISLSPFDPNLWVGSTTEFTITIDDTPPDRGLVSGVAPPVVYSTNPNSSVIVHMSTEANLGDGVGPASAEFTFSISLLEGTTLSEGMLYSVKVNAYDWQSNHTELILNFVIRKEINEAPIFHSLSVSPDTIRLDQTTVDLHLPISITEPDGNLWIFEVLFYGPYINDESFYVHPEDAGIDGSYDGRQYGDIVFPDIMSHLSWVTGDAFGCGIRVDACDDGASSGEPICTSKWGNLYARPSLKGIWSVTVNWGGSNPGYYELELQSYGIVRWTEFPYCNTTWWVPNLTMFNLTIADYQSDCGGDGGYNEAYYVGTINGSSTYISGGMNNTLGQSGSFTMELLSRASTAMSTMSVTTESTPEISVLDRPFKIDDIRSRALATEEGGTSPIGSIQPE